jgi:hypothetical protein
MKHIIQTLMVLLVLTCASAMAMDEVRVTTTDRKKFFPAGGTIKLLNRQGKISFVNARDGSTYTFRRNQIYSIETPMPKEVLRFENIFRSLNYAKVIQLSAKVSLQSKWTGWGSYVEYLKAMAEINLKKYDDAAKTLNQAKASYAVVDRRKALIDFGLKAVTYAQNGGAIIDKPSPSGLLLNGLALEKKNDLRGAALEYMKAKDLFPTMDSNGFPSLDRLAAMTRLVEVLKASRDMGTAQKVVGEIANGQ